MHARPGAGRDRGEADRRERREDRGRLPVVAVLGEEGERRRAAALDRALERRRGHPVDDDEHELLRHVPGLLVPRERSQTGVPLGPRAPEPRARGPAAPARRGSRRPGSRRAPRRRARRRRRAAPCRRACRRASGRRSTICVAPSAPATPPAIPAATVTPAARLPVPRSRSRAGARRLRPATIDGDPPARPRCRRPRRARTPTAAPRPALHADPVPRAHAGTVTARAFRPLFAQIPQGGPT